MKSFKEQLKEKWYEFDKKIAGNVDDPSFHPSQAQNPEKNTEIMLKKLNKIMKTGKSCGCGKK